MSGTKDRSKSGPLRLSAARIDLPMLDRLMVDALALGVFSGERPLSGTAGFCDWRLNGRLSSMLLSGAFTGQPDDTLLTDTNGRIGPARVLLFGLGDRASMDSSAFRKAVGRMLTVVEKARFESLGLELPGLDRGEIEPEEAVKTVLEVARGTYPAARLTLLCPDRAFVEVVVGLAEGDERVRLEEPTWQIP